MKVPKRPTSREVKNALRTLAIVTIHEHRDLMDEDDELVKPATWKEVVESLSCEEILEDVCQDFDGAVADYVRPLLKRFSK